MANLKRWVKGVDRLVFLSPSYYDLFPDQRYRHKLRAIPNAVSMPPADEAALDDKEDVLLYCGRLIQSPKNIVYLLQLWKRLHSDYPTWKMVLCGDGIYRVFAESYISRHKLPRVSITGFTDPNPYYKKAKILVFPSLSEGFAMAILEAMSWGCVPVVFDSSPAYNDIIPDSSVGFVIGGNNKNRYEQTCRRLMDDDSLRRSMAAKAIGKSSDFQVDKIAEMWLNLFAELTGE